MRAREGDLIETLDGSIFDVKGLVHPLDKVVAFIRFTPDENGDRKRNGITYRKVYPLRERYELLRRKLPEFLVFDTVFDEELCEVPLAQIKRHYTPIEGLRNLRCKDMLDDVEVDALNLAELLKRKANISWKQLGLSGSLLIRLHLSTSDIDLIVYGSETCRKVYAALQSLMRHGEGPLRPYTSKELRRLFVLHSKDMIMSFKDFLRIESRKVLQGMFKRREFFIRCVKDWNEVDEKYGDVRYKSMGYAKIRATVIDDSEKIFTPCRYKIANVKILEGVLVKPIKEIVSFRGRFCEQAINHETVLAQGKVEKVRRLNEKEHFRLLLGNKLLDFMVVY